MSKILLQLNRQMQWALVPLLLLALTQQAWGQCTNFSQYPSTSIDLSATNSSGVTTTITTCNFSGEYSSLINAAAGNSYRFTSSIASDYFTIRSGSPSGPVVGSGTQPLTVTPGVSGNLYVHINSSSACGSDVTCRQTAVQCTSCAGGGCINSSVYPSLNISLNPTNTSGTVQQITSCQFGGEYYSVINVIANQSYTFSSSIATDWITVRVGTFNGAILGQGAGAVTVTPSTTNTLFIHNNSDASCGTNTVCRVSSVQCTSCPACPSFEGGAPANVSIVNSSCSSGCTLAGGSIIAPGGTPCPMGSTLQYQVNGGSWTTSLPVYDQDGPAQTIRTRCVCDYDSNNVSAATNPVTTIPGTLANPVVPANGNATVSSPALATQPTPPVVTGCDGSVIAPSGPSIVNIPNPLTCEGTRTYTWTYTCGSTSSTWSFVYTIMDFTPPIVTAGSIAACYPTVAAAEAAALAATSATDNCPGTLTETASTMGTCSAVVTVTTFDANGNSVFVTYNTRIDNTAPTLVCRNTTVFLSAEGTYTLQTSDVFNSAASSDNCPGGLTVTNISPSAVNCSQLNQTIPVTVTVRDGCGNVATCTAQITVQTGTALPAGWNTGNTGAGPGSAGYNPCVAGGQFTVSSTGFTPSLTGESLQEAFLNICGNTTITAHVAGLSGGGWAGITMRESLAPGSRMVALKTQLTNEVRREVRTVTNGIKNTQTIPVLPTADWLRIQRSGNIFTFYASPNGINWSPVGTVTLALNNCLLVGIFAESINVNTTTTAVFGNVIIGGGVAPLAGYTGNEPVQTAAQEAVLSVYPNPTTGEVTVDLSDFQTPQARLQVYNANGQVVQTLELNTLENTTERLDLSSYQNGIYLIRLQAEGYNDAVKRVVLFSNSRP